MKEEILRLLRSADGYISGTGGKKTADAPPAAAEAQGRGSESDRHRKGYFDGAEPDGGAGGAQISAEMQHGQSGQPY